VHATNKVVGFVLIDATVSPLTTLARWRFFAPQLVVFCLWFAMIDALKTLPDYPAVEQLARALWRDGTVRGAAVLVGAGFSRNANLSAADTPMPPLWGDLVKDLVAQLYPDAQADPAKGALCIAEEYRTFSGQAALDDFIRSRFPHRAWLPGKLHDGLLALPWSDVLTTNWDTLLERAAENARDLQYDVVRYEADLPHARAPRIVKLHGTIGDPGPLIFAEEDYRTYPTKHAAYVNLARQIFIENELCLFGFSGDDPNFLQWAGWVRDQLGGSARRIYLAGNLNLPRATRKFLEAHNIAPIDLAPLVEKLPKTEQHGEAAHLFLGALAAAKPHPVGEWRRVPLSDYPMRQIAGDVHLRAHKEDAFAASLLDGTSNVLAKDRASYPGWLVCPYTERQSLQASDEAWILRAATLAIFKPERRVEILAEILWRRTVGLYPLDENFVKLLDEITEVWPDGVDERRRWEFAVALMCDARVDGKADVFNKWAKLVEEMAPTDSPQRQEALYQSCLWARDMLDHHGLAILLPKLTSDDPLFRLRRAALHAELGEFAKATRLIKEAAAALEKAYRLGRTSFWIKARLGWADWLAYLTDMARAHSHTYSPREFKDLKIDPWMRSSSSRPKRAKSPTSVSTRVASSRSSNLAITGMVVGRSESAAAIRNSCCVSNWIS
jgi:SIR2-like protein